MEDARAEAEAYLDKLYRERTGREPEDVANDPKWVAAYRASIDAVYRDFTGREPPDDPDEVCGPVRFSRETPPHAIGAELAPAASRRYGEHAPRPDHAGADGDGRADARAGVAHVAVVH